MPSSLSTTQFDRRFDARRFVSGCVIALMHIGFFYALNQGLVQHVSAVIPNVLIAMIVPAEQKSLDLPKPVPKKIVPTVDRTPEQPMPKIELTPVPTAASNQVTARETSPPPSAPAAPAAAQPPATPKTISGVEYLQAPRPEYPPASRRKGEQGEVQLRVLINSQGRAEQIEIIKSADSARLDEAARQAVMRAIFKPYLENGRPLAVYAIVPIRFHLD